MTRFFCAIFFLVLMPGLQAETVSFPEDDPLFTIEVPAGWEVHNEPDGPLTIQNSDASVVAVFDRRINGVTDAKTARAGVEKQMAETVKTTGYTDLRPIKTVGELRLNDEIDGVGAQYHAKFPSGEPCIYLVILFAPDGSHYCSGELSIKASGLLPETEKKWSAMLASIAPAEADDDSDE